jgi:signal transduction histidine kinase
MRVAVSRGVAASVVTEMVLGGCVAVVLVATAIAEVGAVAVAGVRPADAGTVALALAVAVTIAARRRYPVAVLVALNVVCLIWFWCAYPGLLIVLPPLIGCYTLASQRGWRWGLAGATLTALVGIVGIRVVLGDTGTVGVVPIMVLLAATAGSAGAAAGYYRAVLTATRAELARETRGREERARRVAAEERLRIARELHDVVGHVMATISVQAGVGLHVLEQRPGQAREALAAIKKISDDGLADVKTILGILRAVDPTGQEEPRSSRGGLDRLPDLIGTAEAGGLRVELDVAGERRSLPAPVDLAAYRIIQEALTNVLRHAGARTVRLEVEHEPARLLVRVRDDGVPTCADLSGGHGIDGMRERARALSGRLTAGPHPDGGFEVRAELPVPDAR